VTVLSQATIDQFKRDYEIAMKTPPGHPSHGSVVCNFYLLMSAYESLWEAYVERGKWLVELDEGKLAE
jgi:hypothetical protein